ncbi:MAG TPA: hypothetical protein VHE37_04790, partial [Nevskiaceae bacterium]|nr:hypothetical protein [Nevskiaceae bacterium]
EGKKGAYGAWKALGIPVYQITIQGSTHFEWSLLPTFPATSWCASTAHGVCEGGWGNPLAQFYTVAWFDRWLKNPGEKGYDDADARLLDDYDWTPRYSFYYRSARAYAQRDGTPVACEDIRAGCSDTSTPSGTSIPKNTPIAPASSGGRYGGALGLALLLPLLLGARRRRR